jgi:hypothetical protein
MPKTIRVLTDDTTTTVAGYRQVARRDVHAVFERRWFHVKYVFLLAFCAGWFALLAIMTLAPRPSPAVAIALCGFVNRTRVAIERGVLTIRHGPLPWPGDRSVPIPSIAQLSTEERRSRSGAFYCLSALTKSGEKVVLLDGVPEAEQVLFLEHALAQRLAMVDAPATGEP